MRILLDGKNSFPLQVESINRPMHEGKKATAVPVPVTHVTGDSTQEEAGRPQGERKYTYVRNVEKTQAF